MFRYSLRFALAVAAAASLGIPTAAAQSYPSKPIRLITPYAPGGSTTVVARLIGQKLSESWGQQVLVENRPGNGGNVGSEFVSKAAPDGYTLLVATNGPQAIAPSVFKLNYDNQKDLVGVAMIAASIWPMSSR